MQQTHQINVRTYYTTVSTVQGVSRKRFRRRAAVPRQCTFTPLVYIHYKLYNLYTFTYKLNCHSVCSRLFDRVIHNIHTKARLRHGGFIQRLYCCVRGSMRYINLANLLLTYFRYSVCIHVVVRRTRTCISRFHVRIGRSGLWVYAPPLPASQPASPALGRLEAHFMRPVTSSLAGFV